MTRVPAWLFHDHSQHLCEWQDRSLAVAIGVFAQDGQAVYLNRGMRLYLGGEDPPRPHHTYFINPSFAKLTANQADGSCFAGILTLGDGRSESRSLQAQVWRRQNLYWVIAEFDVLELDCLNTTLSRTNQQINNLQRELLKKNQTLERTLTELRQTQAMLIHAERMNALGQLVAGVAHEINNPLGFIIANMYSLNEETLALAQGYAELEALAHGAEAKTAAQAVRDRYEIDYTLSDIKDLIAACQDGLTRIDRVVSNLRKFSRLHEAETKAIDLKEALQDTLALVKPQLREKDIEVRLVLPDLPEIECHPAELNQVFMNLIVNAVQAMDNGGVLTIQARLAEAAWLELSFADTGHGIPQALLGRVFEPFFTTKPSSSNTGLGLAIAQRIIVEHHGGEITIASTPGHGTTFTLRLPIALPSQALPLPQT